MRVSKAEFAKTCGVSRVTINNACMSGKLKSYAKGRIETTHKLSISYKDKRESKKKTSQKVEVIPPKKPLVNKIEKKNSSSIDSGTDKSTDEIREIQNRNLSPAWVSGQSGNPSGSKKGKRWATVLNDILLEQDPEILRSFGIPVVGDEPVQTLQERIVVKMANMAIQGNEKMIGMIIDRIDGKAMQLMISSELENNDKNRQSEEIHAEAFRLSASIGSSSCKSTSSEDKMASNSTG